MNSAHSRVGLQAVPDIGRSLPALAAASLGMVILFGVALAKQRRPFTTPPTIPGTRQRFPATDRMPA